MKNVKIQIDRIWKGNKGRKEDELLLPPLSYDGTGFPFSLSLKRDELCLCNDDTLLLWTKVSQKAQLVILKKNKVPKSLYWGITSHPNGWIALEQTGDDLRLIFFDNLLETKQSVKLKGFLSDYNVAPPLRVRIHKQETVYFSDQQQLVKVDQRGNTIGVSECHYGYVLKSNGNPLVPNEQHLPHNADPDQVIAIGRNGVLYWQNDIPVPDSRSKYFKTELLVSDQSGSIRSRYILNGHSGIIPELRSPSQISWIEVCPNGNIYLLGWKAEGIKGTVGIWNIRP